MNFSVVVSQFWPLLINGLALGFIYVLISLGYTMVYGVLRLINFANSEIFMVGTFATVIVSRNFFGFNQNTDPLHGFKLVYTLGACLLASMLVSGVTAVLVEIVAYRRLRAKGTNRLASLISAIGVSIILQEGVRILTHSVPMSNPRLLRKAYIFNIGSVGLRVDTLLVIFFAAILFFLVDRFVSKTLLGKAIRAVSMSEETSKLMGVNLNRVISATFLIGGMMTGAAAFLYETVYENTKYNVGFSIGLAAFTAAVLGGIGNLRGAFLGGLSLGLLEEFAAAILGTQWKSVTVFLVLVLVLLFKPNGLFGEAVQQTRV
ncbi:MAG: branched-chain amino acid ABC transporter permease [Actinomycetes bacterium]